MKTMIIVTNNEIDLPSKSKLLEYWRGKLVTIPTSNKAVIGADFDDHNWPAGPHRKNVWRLSATSGAPLGSAKVTLRGTSSRMWPRTHPNGEAEMWRSSGMGWSRSWVGGVGLVVWVGMGQKPRHRLRIKKQPGAKIWGALNRWRGPKAWTESAAPIWFNLSRKRRYRWLSHHHPQATRCACPSNKLLTNNNPPDKCLVPRP